MSVELLSATRVQMMVEEGNISAPIRTIAKWCSEAYDYGMRVVRVWTMVGGS